MTDILIDQRDTCKQRAFMLISTSIIFAIYVMAVGLQASSSQNTSVGRS